ncbi:MAG: class II aldolase/adducin family protein [Wenzhouxiangellaceae bacterium]|nr:class II aldolase/adducin family protein [Wenzhouxiangellaceae bacterium]
MIDEGVIKYRLDWKPGPAAARARVEPLMAWRDKLYRAGLIGHDPTHNVGFGNISLRTPEGFLISGTQTGHLEFTGPEHYSRVTDYDIDANALTCTGPMPASSEALTHAGLYQLDPDINAVVHVHSNALWRQQRGRLPTTANAITYGTPAMAREFQRLYHTTEFADDGIAIMAGHADGIIAIGRDLDQAGERVLGLVTRALTQPES